jgi:hypothetical protein
LPELSQGHRASSDLRRRRLHPEGWRLVQRPLRVVEASVRRGLVVEQHDVIVKHHVVLEQHRVIVEHDVVLERKLLERKLLERKLLERKLLGRLTASR